MAKTFKNVNLGPRVHRLCIARKMDVCITTTAHTRTAKDPSDVSSIILSERYIEGDSKNTVTYGYIHPKLVYKCKIMCKHVVEKKSKYTLYKPCK